MSEYKKSKIASETLIFLEKKINDQIKKGVTKYGHTLDDCPDDSFVWSEMLLEELLDGIQYAAKENIRLRKENQELRERLDD